MLKTSSASRVNPHPESVSRDAVSREYRLDHKSASRRVEIANARTRPLPLASNRGDTSGNRLTHQIIGGRKTTLTQTAERPAQCAAIRLASRSLLAVAQVSRSKSRRKIIQLRRPAALSKRSAVAYQSDLYPFRRTPRPQPNQQHLAEAGTVPDRVGPLDSNPLILSISRTLWAGLRASPVKVRAIIPPRGVVVKTPN